MGIKERREREKQVTRENILIAALKIAHDEGWPALTIRKVADAIEYSAPMIYEYFANKDEILLELMREGYRQLIASMQKARFSVEDRRERIFNVVDAYCDFAQRNPELYQIMNGLGGVPLPIEETTRLGLEACVTPLAAFEDWAQEKGIVLQDAFGIVEIAWGVMHGITSLTLVDRIAGGEQRARLLIHQGIQALLIHVATTQKNVD